jgi:hypothetical protein
MHYLILTYTRTIFFFTMARKVILCLITVIISQGLRDQAFAARNLVSSREVFHIRNMSPSICTPLRWKQSMLKIPIFRGFEGTALSDNRALPYYKLRDDMERQTLDAGFERSFGPKAFRRGAANAVNGAFNKLEIIAGQLR